MKKVRWLILSILFSLPMLVQALLATAMTCGLTTLGALTVYCFGARRQTLLGAMLAAGAGVMLASAFFSLLLPCLEMAQELNQPGWLLASAGFLCGGAMLQGGEWLFERLTHPCQVHDLVRRRRLLIASITLHNIPEGLAVGVAFGAALSTGTAGAYQAAWMLALGIGIQNFPEGAAVSLPLHRDGMSKGKASFCGFLSGAVEPIAGLLGALLAASAQVLLPFLLAFAAGAMVLVVVSELVPESQRSGPPAIMTLSTMIGFTIMMLLDVMLG